MYTTDEKLRFLDRLIDGVEDQRKKEILSEIRSDVATLPATARMLETARGRFQKTSEKLAAHRSNTKELAIRILKESGVYDDIISEAKRAAESAASQEYCRVSGINL